MTENNQPEGVSPKLQQFADEMQEVCDRYGYIIKPILVYRPEGITASVKVVEKLPEKKQPKPEITNKTK